MKFLVRVFAFAFWGLISSPGAAASCSNDTLLVYARLENVTLLSAAAPPGPPNVVYLARPLRHEFRILKVLSGHAHEGALILDFERQSWPAAGFDYFLIVNGRGKGMRAAW